MGILIPVFGSLWAVSTWLMAVVEVLSDDGKWWVKTAFAFVLALPLIVAGVAFNKAAVLVDTVVLLDWIVDGAGGRVAVAFIAFDLTVAVAPLLIVGAVIVSSLFWPATVEEATPERSTF